MHHQKHARRHVWHGILRCENGHPCSIQTALIDDTRRGVEVFVEMMFQAVETEIRERRVKAACAVCGSPFEDWDCVTIRSQFAKATPEAERFAELLADLGTLLAAWMREEWEGCGLMRRECAKPTIH